MTARAAGNVACYTPMPGMCLVKKGINQDGVLTDHLFYVHVAGSARRDFSAPASSSMVTSRD